jgi:hypothetical protein
MSDLSPSRHEHRDVNIPGLLICAGVLAATVALAFFAAWWAFDYLSARDKSKPSAFPLAAQERDRLPPEPRLEEIDRLEGKKGNVRPKEVHAGHERMLETYGWVDEKAGVVRIPISRAMKIIVDNNLLPARPDEAGDRKLERERPRPGAANSGRLIWRE